MQQSSIASNLSPRFSMVAKYFAASIFAYVLLNFLLMLNYDSIQGHYFQPIILALVHIGTLGWITMIIFGAMFQLVPVVLEVKLFSELMGEIQFWIFLVGAAGLITGFWNFDTGIHLTASAIFLAAAMLLFIINITVTMFRVKKWNITGVYLAAALFYLLSTAAAGLLMAINLGHPFIKGNHLQYLKLHADVALIGWVTMIIMGVSYKLIPMFTLSHGYSMKSAVWAFVLVNTGLLGLTTVMHYENLGLLYSGFVCLTAAGIFFFLFQIYLIIKKRIRKKLDIGLKHSIVSFFFMGLTALLGVYLVLNNFKDIFTELRLVLLYGYLVIFGFFSMLTVGQLYKILPFLAWYHKYSSKVGLEKVPLLKDMYSEKSASLEFVLMTAALAAGIPGLLFSLSGLLLISFSVMFISSLIFAYNMISIIRT